MTGFVFISLNKDHLRAVDFFFMIWGCFSDVMGKFSRCVGTELAELTHSLVSLSHAGVIIHS